MSDDRPNPNARRWRHDDEPNYEHHGFLGSVCESLGRPSLWKDDQGYEHEITAAAVHPGEGHVAWVECRQKKADRDGGTWLDIEYRLKALVDGQPAIDWILETYNPFFGCDVGYLAWHGNRLVMIYREKHDSYACCIAASEQPRLVEIADHWLVDGKVIAFCRWGADLVERLSIPGLEPLAPLTGTEARETGLLQDA